ncbi:MAG TPA: hypothetical protein H9707_08115, partial [Candidatus Butyricicoccus avicola]|nr:hypothetical protein [Candidatus Butyricicoccus avicola]
KPGRIIIFGNGIDQERFTLPAEHPNRQFQVRAILDAIHGNKPCFVFFHPAQTSDKNRDIFLDFLAGLA